MAAKDLHSGDIKKHQLDDMTTCCICTEVYTDPKVLPCIHTFCKKCIQETGLKTKKGPGDEMPCPICRRLFKIPPEGFHGLPKHFFIEKLILLANASDQSASSRFLCDACIEENQEESGKEISTAETYCVDCNQKFCEECCRQHRKFKLTKNHKMIDINEHDQNLSTYQAQSVCEMHRQRVLDVFCADCKTVVCAICFIDDHKNHDGSHVDKFADNFRKQIENNAEVINECRSKSETKKAQLLEVKENMQERVIQLECDVANRIEELKQLIDKHATSLLQGLFSIRQSKLKEIRLATDDIETYLSCLEAYNSYCHKIMDKGSASDICRAFSTLSVRAMELQQQCQPLIEREIQSLNFCFRKSGLEEFLEESCDNLIGEIGEEVDSKQKKRSTKMQFAVQSNETDLLRSKSELKEFLEESCDNMIEIEESRKKSLNLEEKLKEDLKEIEQRMLGLAQEKQRLLAEFRHKSDPVLIQTIRTNSDKKKKLWFRTAEETKGIRGLTILDKELFVVSHGSSEVEVYDSTAFSFSRRWNLKELDHPMDIASCNRNKCLYINNIKVSDLSAEILRVDPKGKLIKIWSTRVDFGHGLSVTDESNVILIGCFKNILNEYSPDGQLIREINLSSDAGICNTSCAIKLTDGHFMISHGSLFMDDDALHRVCLVDADGNLRKSFGGKCGSTIGQMNDPVHLAVDGNGFVMVVDLGNGRVLLLDSDLQFKREILSKEKHGLQSPSKILFDESNGRLFVADNESENQRILIFAFNN